MKPQKIFKQRSKERKEIKQQKPQRPSSNYKMSNILKSLNGFKPKNVSNLFHMIPAKQLSTATKKLYGMIKKSVSAVPSYIMNDQQQLLPKIDAMPYLQQKKFNEYHQQISEGFHSFRLSLISNQSYVEEQQLLSLQTSKCYKHIAKHFFEEQISSEVISKMLKKRSQNQEIIFQLIDYRDEVEYNINLQVDHKMKVFLNFVDCLKNIKCLVEMSISKVQITRLNNNLIKDLIVHRSRKINQLRIKQQSMIMIKKYLQQLKKLKQLEVKIFNSANVSNKGKILSLHHQYCILHQNLKKYCCSKYICKYWDINYCVDRCYQDCLIKSLRSYLSQVIILPKEPIKRIFSSKSLQFQSVPLSQSILNFDESYEVQQTIMLVTKMNIERDIVQTFRQGMHRCTYATDQLNKDLKILLNDYLLDLYSTINEVVKDKHKSILRCQPLSAMQKTANQNLSKVGLTQFIEIIKLVSQSLETIVKRCFSVINKLMQCGVELEQSQKPERYQVIRTYLLEINKQMIEFVNNTMSELLSFRTIKDNQIQLGRKLIEICREWEEFVQKIPRSYPFIREKYQVESISKYRSSLIRRSYDSMHNKVMTKDLKKVLEEDTYQSVMVNPRLYDVIGYILDGLAFRKQQTRKQKNLLSSSLLLDRRSFSLDQSGIIDSRVSVKIHEISLQQDHIIIDSKPYRIIQSTEFILDFIFQYMQNYDEHTHLRDEIKGKLTQLVLIYIAQLRQLILNSKALTLPYKKIKGKSINAKHLLLTYVQLTLIKTICEGWKKRISMDQQNVSLLILKINKNIEDTKTKFNRILQARMIEIIEKKNQKQFENEIIWQVINNVKTTMELLNEIIKDRKQFINFTGGKQWRKIFIQKIQNFFKNNFQEQLQLFLTQIQPYTQYFDDLIPLCSTYHHE